jgi:peptidyl-tRNA hydrolase, PTH1 family
MYLAVGLGNPGSKYQGNRHNVGFMVVDHLASEHRFPEWREKFSGMWTKGSIEGEDVVLLKPMTYMNESGRSVQPAVAFFHVDAKSQLCVLHDELDLAFADVRIKIGGGHAGHNGLRSIMGVLGGDFARVRIGIGRPPPEFRGDVADFVLQGFDPVEAATLGDVIGKSADATLKWIAKGPLAANETNVRDKRGRDKKGARAAS